MAKLKSKAVETKAKDAAELEADLDLYLNDGWDYRGWLGKDNKYYLVFVKQLSL